LRDQQNLPAIRPAFILTAQASNPISLGSVGFWFDGATIFRVAANGTQSPVATGASLAAWLDGKGADITKVGGGTAVAGTVGLAADASHRHQLDPAAFKSFYFSGLAAPGAVAAQGANVGDRVVDVESLNDLANGAGSFEATITVANQIQQTDATDLSKKKFRALVIAQS
jgi:hypothetical protein